MVATAVVTGFAKKKKAIHNFNQVYVTRLAKLVVVVPHPATLPETEAALAPETSLSISRLGGMREEKTIFVYKLEWGGVWGEPVSDLKAAQGRPRLPGRPPKAADGPFALPPSRI